jgi:uncharacterized protein YdiU (UPF0061 family)
LLVQTSPEYIGELKHVYDERQKVLNKLGVGTQTRQTLVLTEKLIQRYTVQYHNITELWRLRYNTDPDDRLSNMNLLVKADFDLSAMFEKWYSQWRNYPGTKKVDHTFLFCDIDKTNAGKLLVPATVQFKGPYPFLLHCTEC